MSAGEEQRRPPAMHLEVTGSGPAVVLTHGFADDSTTFDALAASLAPRHRVCRWDLLRHGRSRAGPEPASRRTALRWLDAAVRSVGQGPAVLVGHSPGGHLSLCRAVLDPTGVAGLVVLAAGPRYRKAAKRAERNAFIADYARTRGVDPLAAASGYSPTASSWTGCRPSSCRSSSWPAATIGATTPAAG